jgi:hypothetical protein
MGVRDVGRPRISGGNQSAGKLGMTARVFEAGTNVGDTW